MKQLITVLTILLFSTAVMAQDKKADSLKRQHKSHWVDKNKKEQNLSQEQKEKMAAIRAEYKSKHEAVKSSSISEEEKKKKMMELRKQQHEAKMAVYTPEQKAEVKKRMADRKEMRGKEFRKDHPGRKHAGKGRGMKRMSDLQLTEDQKGKMEAISKETREKVAKIKNNADLTEDAKNTEIKKIRTDQRTKMNAILTAEQKEKMKSGRKTYPRTSVPRENPKQ